MKNKAVFNWSGGKDSALALQKVLNDGEYEITSLLTSVNSETKESSMHHIPLSLLKKQAIAMGLELYIVDLTPKGDMSDYKSAMSLAVDHFKALGVKNFIFGDIYLHDVRKYREEQLLPLGITVVEPLWDMTPEQVMDEFIASGLKNIVITINNEILDESFIGKIVNRDFVKSLPAEVDICGENGEYHTFCYGGGTLFSEEIKFEIAAPSKVTYSIKTEDGNTEEYSYCFGKLSDTDE